MISAVPSVTLQELKRGRTLQRIEKALSRRIPEVEEAVARLDDVLTAYREASGALLCVTFVLHVMRYALNNALFFRTRCSHAHRPVMLSAASLAPVS